jgi:CoA:oxalate CoA-transferase
MHEPPVDKSDRHPLAGVLVIDLGQVYQGPYASFLLAQAGATVIKVEPPKGEPVRHRALISKGNAVPFAMLNANKRNLSLNLKTPEGVDILKKLSAKADVLIENYAPGVLDRLGVGYSVLSEINPRLIYATATGYGPIGTISPWTSPFRPPWAS